MSSFPPSRTAFSAAESTSSSLRSSIRKASFSESATLARRRERRLGLVDG